MADYTPTAVSKSSNFISGPSGDKTNDVLSDLLANRTELYGLVTDIADEFYSATPPANPNVGRRWRCSTTAGLYVADTTYRWNGSAWDVDLATAVTVPNRNSILEGPVNSAGATILFSAGTGLTCDLKATVRMTFASGYTPTGGASDAYEVIDTDDAGFWSSLPANSTLYLCFDRDSGGVVTGTYSTLAPVYQSYAPAHSAGLHWFNTNEQKMYISNGSTWTQVWRIFVGTATTDTDSIIAVSVYAYGGAVGSSGGSIVNATDIITKGPWVDVRAFGAVGDGVTDDSTALISCFADVPAGVDIYFPPGTYKVSGSASIERSVSGNIIFAEGAIIDAMTSTAPVIVSLTGSLGAHYVNTASITAGDITVTVHSMLAASLSTGDIVRFSTNIAFDGNGDLWNSGRAYYFKGELQEVLSVSGSDVTFKNPMFDSYGANTVAAMKMNYVTTMVDGFRLKANKLATAQSGLIVYYGKNVNIRGGEITGASSESFAVYHTYNFTIDSVAASDNYVADLGLCYGVGVASSQYGSIVNCKVTAGRHGVSMGGWEPTRHIIVSNCTIDSNHDSNVASADAHGNCDYITYVNNDIKNGASSGARNIKWINNRVTGVTASGISLYGDGPITNGNWEIIGNTIISSSISNVQPIVVYVDGTMNTLIIDMNTINSNVGIALSCKPAKTLVVNKVNVSNNTAIINSGNGINFDSGTFTDVVLFKNDFNIITGTARAIVWNTALSTNIDLLYNTLQNNIYNSTTIEISSSGANIIRFIGNKYSNPNLSYGKITLIATSYIEFTHNCLTGLRNGPWALTAKEILITNNRLSTVTGDGTITGKYYESIAGNNVVTSGTAPPATGVWAVGDTCINTATASGGTERWKCTVAGTPGTWIPEGIVGAIQGVADADSTATDVAGLKADLNDLLAKLRTAKLIAT